MGVGLWQSMVLRAVRILARRELPVLPFAERRWFARWAANGRLTADSRVTVRGKLHGCRVPVCLGPREQRTIYLTGRDADLPTQLLLLRLLRAGDAVIDHGAGLGEHALLAARLVAPGGHVSWSESDPSLADRLAACLEANHVEGVTRIEPPHAPGQPSVDGHDSTDLSAPPDAPQPARVVLVRLAGALHFAPAAIDRLLASCASPPVVVVAHDPRAAPALKPIAGVLHKRGFACRRLAAPRDGLFPTLRLELADLAAPAGSLLWYHPAAPITERIRSLL